MSRHITTSAFTIAPGVYARRDMAAIAERHWWIPAMPAIVFATMAIGDWRWAVVALAIFFVVTPMIAMFVWISLLGKPAAIRDTMPHTLTIIPNDKIVISWTENARPIVEVPLTDVESINYGNLYVFIRYVSPDNKDGTQNKGQSRPATEIAIPIAAFTSRQDAATAYATIAAPGKTGGSITRHDGV